MSKIYFRDIPKFTSVDIYKSMLTKNKNYTLPVFFIILLMIISTSYTLGATSKTAFKSSKDLVLKGNRILIISSDIHAGSQLGEILKELYRADVDIKGIDDYISYIDEAIYDAFVYLGAEYSKLPIQDFIDDIERTNKPVLWINYHGWTLNQKYLKSKGISIIDDHDLSYKKIVMKETYELTATDITLIKAQPEKVIYYLQNDKGERTPGAVHSDNYTFIAYTPNLDIFAQGFFPFLKAIKITFGSIPAPIKNKVFNYIERIDKARADEFRTGVHLPVYTASSTKTIPGYEDDRWHENLVRIKQSGAEWVNLVRIFYQTNIYSSDIHADKKKTPTKESLQNIIEDAHRIGLKVQLHLAINLLKPGRDHWHGMIKPKNREKWWDMYKALVLDMAEFSRQNEVEALIIGTEYSAMQSQTSNWRSLIRMIRQQSKYPGMLGYGANYNALNFSWSDDLDFLGISAYWPLSESRDPDLQTLNQSWNKINKELKQWKTRHPKLRIEFTEVGYSSQPYSSVFPFSWKSHKGKAQSLTEQLQTYRALYLFLKREKYIKGVHIFASTSEDNEKDSIGYTPFGKPAEKVLRQIIKIR